MIVFDNYYYLLLEKSPEPIEPWTGIHDASDYGSNCLQTTFNFSQFWGEEDCLFLNVYTPSKVIIGIIEGNF